MGAKGGCACQKRLTFQFVGDALMMGAQAREFRVRSASLLPTLLDPCRGEGRGLAPGSVPPWKHFAKPGFINISLVDADRRRQSRDGSGSRLGYTKRDEKPCCVRALVARTRTESRASRLHFKGFGVNEQRSELLTDVMAEKRTEGGSPGGAFVALLCAYGADERCSRTTYVRQTSFGIRSG